MKIECLGACESPGFLGRFEVVKKEIAFPKMKSPENSNIGFGKRRLSLHNLAFVL